MSESELDQLLDAWNAPAPPPSLRRGMLSALPMPWPDFFRVARRWAAVAVVSSICIVLGAAGMNPMLSRFDMQIDELYLQSTRLVTPSMAHARWWFWSDGYSSGSRAGLLHGSAYLHNRFTGNYIGYEYTMQPAGDGLYRVAFSQMQLSTLQKHQGPFKENWQQAVPVVLPAPQTVRVGEPFEVTLYENGIERVYDRIVLSRTPTPGWPGVYRQVDRTVMRLRQPQLYINGQLTASQPSAGSGPVIWVHLPGQGRFLIALDPQQNSRFVQAGHVNGKEVEFQSEGTQFRIVCTDPITTGGDRPVYVYHQQRFEDLLNPNDPRARQFLMGNAGPANLHQ